MLPDNFETDMNIIKVPAYLGPNYDKFWEEVGFTKEQLRHLTKPLSNIVFRKDAPLFWDHLEFHTKTYDISELMGFLEQVPAHSKVRIEKENKRYGRKKHEISYGYLIEAFFWEELNLSCHLKVMKRYQEMEDARKERMVQGRAATEQREVNRLREEARKLGYRVVKKST